jgi:heptosyltransferase-1
LLARRAIGYSSSAKKRKGTAVPREGSPRFLIARMSAIGDTVLTLPVLCALRRAFPQAFIAWIVERAAAPMLQGHDALDELIVLPRLWLKSPREIWRLRSGLSSLRIETTIDPQSVSKTALACWLSGAPRRIGFGGHYGKELSPWLNNERLVHRQAHITDRSLELLEPLGVQPGPAEFRVPRSAPAQATIAAHLSKIKLENDYAIVNPGARWDSKLWPLERYAEVVNALASDHGLRSVVVWAGDRERAWAEAIVAAAPKSALLAPKTDLLELTALLRRARIFVGSDTGPMHTAAAVGTPCVAMYGTTRPEDCGPYGPEHIALQARYDDGSRSQRRSATNEAMCLITAAQVLAACHEILRRPIPQKNAA